MNSRALYLRLLAYVRPYRRQFGAALFCILLLGMTEPLIPVVLKPLLDGTFVERDPEFLRWAPFSLAGLFLLRGTLSFLTDTLFAWVAGRLVQDLRLRMFERLLLLPTTFYDAHATGNIIAKLTHNVMQVAQAATRVLMILVRDSVIVVGLLSYMLWLDWRLSLVVFLLLPLLVLVVRIIARRLRGLSRQLQDNVGRMTHALEESVRGHKVVKLYGGEAMERERFARLANWTRRLMFKEKVADAASMPLVEANAALMIGLLIYLGTGQSGGAPMSVGAFVSFLAALGLLFPPIKRLTQVNHPLQRGLAGAETIFAMIDEVAEAETGARQIKRAQGRLSFDQVRFRYPGAERNALDGISFDLEPGRTLALVGPSGGGKTSIAALIPRFYDPDWGSVLLDGQDIRAYSRRDLRNQIAYVGQEAVLFNDTVARNIGYGIAPPPDAARLREAARRAHALEFIEALSQGFDTPIGEQGLRLSGGQRQRIAIARALIRDAPILILDEATSALDTHAEAEVQAALAELARDRATLVIAHRLSTIEHADRILVIRDGRVVEAGTHAELLAAGGEYHSLHSRQFRNEGL